MDATLHDGRSSYQRVTGSSSAPRLLGEHRGPSGHPGPLAEEVDLDTAGGQVAVGDQADQSAGPQPPGSVPKAAPPVCGSTSMPRPSR